MRRSAARSSRSRSFSGGAELEAAEKVTGAPLGVLDALVAKSLVVP